MVPRNEVNDACDQAVAQRPMAKNRNAKERRKVLMRTTSRNRTIPLASALFGGVLYVC